ncbi:PTS system N-acetylglucosamine-specific IIA component [Sediminihabitans luteus]|uniref:PTS system N-acetylglucosamine-specific IIA component n=1 Tax=Sediminihabitans luteus TaxID=1138585 RepID=A0A2M9CY59_9CELL|nr:PTS glucose transporter subunit IIA [Sediminihabitans luteus]PJJ76827.1 PTS system N-acetylglucosamine-specific IIA component [Sediminihabitans luteus]GIJ00306.1 PTS glucose transporter subunit IIA [Sediminihabitans luteus]
MTAPLTVLAPVTGVVVALAEVDDPVFSAELVGPGLAIEPVRGPVSEVLAPVAGRIAKMHAHAFVVQGEDGRAVLVHLGINTVQLEGEGFTLHAAEGDDVALGQVLVSWDPAAVEAGGRSPVVPVVGLDAGPDHIARLVEPGDEVAAGTPLITWG